MEKKLKHPKLRRIKEKDSNRKQPKEAKKKNDKTANRLRVAMFRAKLRKSAEEPGTSSALSERSRWRQKRKLSDTLPATPVKRKKCLKNAIDTLTPNSKEALHNEGIYNSDVGGVATDFTKEIFEHLRPGTSHKESDSGHHVYKVVKSSLAKTAQKKGVGKKLVFTKLGLSQGPKKKEKGVLWNAKYTRKKRSDAVEWATKVKINIFYQQDDVSRTMPNKKD